MLDRYLDLPKDEAGYLAASKWLQDYAAQVNQQVTDRMQEWNTQSVKYATEMNRLCDALSSVLDELESRSR